MHRKFRDGGGRNVWMFGQQRLGPASEWFREVAIVNRFVAGKIGPAIPDIRLHAPKQIGRAPNWAAAAFVVAVVGRVELAVRAEGEAEWISKTPRDELEIGSIRAHAINGA